MATPSRIRLERELRQEAERSGVAWAILPGWPRKQTYYTPDGRALPNLPADPWSMERYLKKGFTLAPPQGNGGAEPEAQLVCKHCGRSDFKAPIGRISHERNCKEEETK